MKTPIKLLLSITAIFLSATALGEIKNDVDMEKFLSKHDFSWDTVPKDRGNSAFLGNGLLGSTIWSAREEALHWDLGRSDAYETIPQVRSRMAIGKLVLKTQGKAIKQQMHQSLFKAEASGIITTEKGQISWRSMMPKGHMVGLIEYTVSGSEKVDFEFKQLPAMSNSKMFAKLRDLLRKDKVPRRLEHIHDFSEPVYEKYLEQLKQNQGHRQADVQHQERQGQIRSSNLCN
ncbi:hypothetical protein BVY04_00190 [bacterium M21]|nr:hypothetical protein BVY04_00190 [bacterium M21]